MFEQEPLSRWNITETLTYPAFKVTDEDDVVDPAEIKPDEVKSAQALTGALLWLSTRTRPDLVHGVSVMFRLVTKHPKKSLRGNPGGMHLPRGVPNQWGARGQLKVQRHSKLLEVFADISYSGGAGHRSIQGLVVCFAGVPTMWMSSRQFFLTHSTAEAEFVTYCEGLLARRSSESLLCAIWGEELNSSSKLGGPSCILLRPLHSSRAHDHPTCNP